MRVLRLASLLLPLAVCGCLEVKDQVKIAADGSGTIRQSFAVDVAKADELVQLLKEILSTPDVPTPDPIAPAWIRKAAEGVEGYTLEKVDVQTTEKEKRTTVEGKFTSLEAAAKAGAFFSSRVTLEKTEAGPWKLTLHDGPPKGSSGGAPGGMDFATILTMVEDQVKGLSLTRTFTLPSKVLETNGTKSEDGLSVSATVDYKKLSEGKDIELTIVFEAAEGLKLTPFKFSPSMDMIMRRAMEAPPSETEKGEKPSDATPKEPEKPSEPK